MVTGGYWFDSRKKRWVCASTAVREHIRTHAVDARLLGVPIQNPHTPGKMLLPPLPSPAPTLKAPPVRRQITWPQTKSATLDPALVPDVVRHGHGPWNTAKSVTVKNGDVAHVGAEVLVRLPSFLSLGTVATVCGFKFMSLGSHTKM